MHKECSLHPSACLKNSLAYVEGGSNSTGCIYKTFLKPGTGQTPGPPAWEVAEDRGLKVILDPRANLRLPRATEVAAHQNNRLVPFQEGNQTKIPKGKNIYCTPRRLPKRWRGGLNLPIKSIAS